MTQRWRDGRRVRRPFSVKREEDRGDAETVKSDRCYDRLDHNYSDSEEIDSRFADHINMKQELKYLCVSANAYLLK